MPTTHDILQAMHLRQAEREQRRRQDASKAAARFVAAADRRAQGVFEFGRSVIRRGDFSDGSPLVRRGT